MLRELRYIDRWHDVSDALDYGAANGLWFRNRERVLDALIKRGLIESTAYGWDVTETGRAAIAEAEAA